MKMTALIDADHMQYILGNQVRDQLVVTQESKDLLRDMAFSIIEMTCVMTNADKLLLALSDPTRSYFRNKIYRYKPYKGNRRNDEWFEMWRPHILQILHDLGGQFAEEVEADDLLSYFAEIYRTVEEPYIICSPDKDLAQIPGSHFDYSKKFGENFQAENPIRTISPQEAEDFLYLQILQGDTSDNIAGIPKMGPVKAKLFLKEINERIEIHSKVLQKYCETFGPFYGPIIFDETWKTVMLLNSNHPHLHKHLDKLHKIQFIPWTGRKVEGQATLDSLGW